MGISTSSFAITSRGCDRAKDERKYDDGRVSPPQRLLPTFTLAMRVKWEPRCGGMRSVLACSLISPTCCRLPEAM
ncbi:hypothetical protein PsYK624_086730 [Phanerochaete sordida]|uniref:Uncharacterized protein n=1 Tax=Phanerochaete sordida TaxID=48140 RepID=A0A9P3GDT9_9APHY|nr:hypothetical protein PsYK624_086730 [Phanerochaete sordida]